MYKVDKTHLVIGGGLRNSQYKPDGIESQKKAGCRKLSQKNIISRLITFPKVGVVYLVKTINFLPV